MGTGAIKQATVLPSGAHILEWGADSELSRDFSMFEDVGAKRRGKAWGEGWG